MLKPARAKSCTVASCSDPFGNPSLSTMTVSCPRKRCRETTARAGVAHSTVAEAPHLQQDRIVVAIGEHLDDLEAIAGRLALRPQRLPRAGVERRIAGRSRP